MGTPLEDVYGKFMGKVTDFRFIELNEQGLLEDTLKDYLNSAIVRFVNCNKDLSYDESVNEFNEELSFYEKEILATWMTYYYITTKVNNVKNLEVYLSEADYNSRSKASNLNALISHRQEVSREASSLQSAYDLYETIDELWH